MSIDLTKVEKLLLSLEELNLPELKSFLDMVMEKYGISANLDVSEDSSKEKENKDNEEDSSRYSLIISKLPTSNVVGFYLLMKNILEKVGVSHSILQVKNLCIESERDKKPLASISKSFFKENIEKEIKSKGFDASFDLK